MPSRNVATQAPGHDAFAGEYLPISIFLCRPLLLSCGFIDSTSRGLVGLRAQPRHATYVLCSGRTQRSPMTFLFTYATLVVSYRRDGRLASICSTFRRFPGTPELGECRLLVLSALEFTPQFVNLFKCPLLYHRVSHRDSDFIGILLPPASHIHHIYHVGLVLGWMTCNDWHHREEPSYHYHFETASQWHHLLHPRTVML